MDSNSPSRTSRREALKSLGGLAAGLPLLSSAFASEPTEAAAAPSVHTSGRNADQPNILWITGEGVPLSVLSSYGSTLIDTPNIDRIANEGMLFENAFCTNALCAPSRATMLTGKYSHRNGMTRNIPHQSWGRDSTFDASQETVPQLLREGGYQTGMVGKWHLPANPGKVGFDYFIFKHGAGGPYYNENGYLQNPSLGSTTIEKASYPGYITDNLTDKALEGIEQFDQPFCMMVQFFNDHRPFDPPHRYEDFRAGERIPEPSTFWDDYEMRSAAAEEARMRISQMPDFDPPDDLTLRQRKQWNYQQFMHNFLGTLKAQDENVGRLLDYLDETGLAENTIVVYTSDHGFFLGDHGWFDKRFMYEESIRIPWMIRYPGQVEEGTRNESWVVDIDDAPTMLDLTGTSIPSDMQGRSLTPLFDGDTPEDWRTSMYYHYYEFGGPHWVQPSYGIRTERYKLISYYTLHEWELFDLEKDPDEMENLLAWGKAKPGYTEVAQDLAKQLKQLREKYEDDRGRSLRFRPQYTFD